MTDHTSTEEALNVIIGRWMLEARRLEAAAGKDDIGDEESSLNKFVAERLRKCMSDLEALRPLVRAQLQPNRGALIELLSNAYNEGFCEGMREHSSAKGGWPWSDRKQKYGALLDKALALPSTPSRDAFIRELRAAPSLDENGYICVKDEAISAFDRSALPSRARAASTDCGAKP